MANEKRLIDANEFWNRLSHVVYDIFTYPDRPCDFARVGYYTETIQTVLEQTKTVDAVEVVRCKDCDYYEKRYIGFGHCNFFEAGRADNDFCSSCIRREGDGQ